MKSKMKATSKTVFKTLAGATLCTLAGLGFYALTTHFQLILPSQVEATHVETAITAPPAAAVLAASAVAPTASDEDSVEEVVDTAPTLGFLYVDVAARVSESDGATVALKVKGRAATCDADASAPSQVRQTWSSAESQTDSDLALIEHWCIPVKPGTPVAYRPFSGDWTSSTGPVDADSASNYLRYTTPGGQAAAIKTTALAACDDDKGCGFVVSASVGLDDSRIQTNIPTGHGLQCAWLNSDDDSSQPETVAQVSPTASSGYRLTSPTIRIDGQ
jgi:hypothetical protein